MDMPEVVKQVSSEHFTRGKRAGASMLEILSRSACSLSVPGVASFGHAAAGARWMR